MTDVVLPAPVKRSGQTVTFRRQDWERILDHIEQLEDAVAVSRALSPKDVRARDYLTSDEMRRLLNWENPVKLWREKRGLSQRALAAAAGVSPSYLAEIESDRKPGSADALYRLSRKLEIPMEFLTPDNRLERIGHYVEGLAEAGENRDVVVGAARSALTEAARIGRAWHYGAGFHDFVASLLDHWRDRVQCYEDAGLRHEAIVLKAVMKDCFETEDGVIRLSDRIAIID